MLKTAINPNLESSVQLEVALDSHSDLYYLEPVLSDTPCLVAETQASPHDHPSPQDHLGREEEIALARAIEAGVLAQSLLDSDLLIDELCYESQSAATVPAATQGIPQPHDVIFERADLLLVAAAGQQAWQQFLSASTGLIWSQALHLARCHNLDAQELFQEGFVILAECLRRFDYTVGRFSTFAVPQIRDRLLRIASGRMGQLNLPPSTARIRAQLLTIVPESGQRNPTIDLEQTLGSNWRSLQRIMEYRPPILIRDDIRADQAELKSSHQHTEETDLIERGLRILSNEEAAVIKLRYGLACNKPLIYQAIAQTLGSSATSIRRIEQRALGKMRKALG